MRAERANRRILGFDSWTKGAHHFERLVPALASYGIELQLVHLGSWGNDPGRPAHERIGALSVRDISSYGSRSLDHILDVEQPEAVVFLSIETFAHRAFIRYCHRRSIPTLLLYHGLVNVQVTSDERGSYGVNRLAHAKFVYSKLGKLLKNTFPCYIGALIKTGARADEWLRFVADVRRMAAGKTSLMKPAKDAKTTHCTVFTNADIEHAVRTYGFRATEVRTVGNPDLARFGLSQDMVGSRLRERTLQSHEVMYLDTGLASMGFIFESQHAFLEHLTLTAAALAAQGYTLYLKPHPAHDPAALREGLAGSGITLVSNADFLSRLRSCVACIAETTTLAMIPALLGMPLLYANYGALRQLRFGPVLASYPRGYILGNLTDVSSILARSAEEFDVAAITKWIDLNVGPLPAEDMPRRVAKMIAHMVGEAAQPDEVAPGADPAS